jgi:DNA-binding CsgD family transcriptional regulator
MVGASGFTRKHRDKLIAMPDPWDDRLAQLRQSRPTGVCRIGSSYLPFRDLRRSGYFEMVTDEEMQVGPLVTLYVEGDDSGSGLPPTRLVVVRGPRDPDFTDETARLMSAIHAPLRAAVRNYWAFTRIRQLERAPETAYHALPQPVLVLRGDAGIEYANAAADALLVRGNLLAAAGGHLVRAGSYSSAKLGLFLSAASRGIAQQVAIFASAPIASAGAVLHLTRLPPETAFEARWPRASVLATVQLQPAIDTAAKLPALARRFGFTSAESDILKELSSGATPSDIAERRQVRVSTVRTQIRGLLEKSGSRRQADLVRLLLG